MNNGTALFRKAYGDYYVCGYELGADAGATLSATTESMASQETLTLTLTVKALFWEKTTPPVTETWKKASASSTLEFCGYSTLGPMSEQVAVKGTSAEEQKQLQQRAKDYLELIPCLRKDVDSKLAELSLEDGQKLPLAACSRICRSGLVVQLLLAPYARLNEYVQHAL